MNAAAEQGFADIDIAKTRNQLLIQQSGFNRCTPAPKQLCQCLSCHGGRKGLHTQMREKAMILLLACANKIDAAKAPGIDKPCPRTAVRLQN